MKKMIVMASLLLGAMFSANAQDSDSAIEVRGGVYLGSLKAEFMGVKANTSGTGFYAGAGYSIPVSDKFHVVPGLDIVLVKFDGGDLNHLQIPISGKFLVSEKLSFLAGPNIGYIFSAEEGTKSVNLAVDAGASYSITESLNFTAKYQYGLTNLLDMEGMDGVTVKLSAFVAGIGYKL